MTSLRLAAALTMMLVSTSRSFAADLAKIDRTILKQPPYESMSPKSCLLACGAAAKTTVRMVEFSWSGSKRAQWP